MKNTSNILCSCCINTYKRPELLKKLINSLSNQKLGINILLEIIVVDNDPDKQAQEVIKSFKKETLLNIKYYTQPVKNISITRNKAVSETIGELILFIDDDGYADVNWINEFVKCLYKYSADAVFGTVIPYYEKGVPHWIKEGAFFERLIQKTGEISKFTRTTNCIIKADLLKTLNGPFNPEFGLTGGEDSDLFGRLSNLRAKCVFCAEAIVYDFVPKERANLKWMIKRSYSIGITTTETKISFSKNKIRTEVYLLFKGILYLIISTILLIFCFPSKVWSSQWLLKLIGNLGHISAIFKIRYEQYK